MHWAYRSALSRSLPDPELALLVGLPVEPLAEATPSPPLLPPQPTSPTVNSRTPNPIPIRMILLHADRWGGLTRNWSRHGVSPPFPKPLTPRKCLRVSHHAGGPAGMLRA